MYVNLEGFEFKCQIHGEKFRVMKFEVVVENVTDL